MFKNKFGFLYGYSCVNSCLNAVWIWIIKICSWYEFLLQIYNGYLYRGIKKKLELLNGNSDERGKERSRERRAEFVGQEKRSCRRRLRGEERRDTGSLLLHLSFLLIFGSFPDLETPEYLGKPGLTYITSHTHTHPRLHPHANPHPHTHTHTHARRARV